MHTHKARSIGVHPSHVIPALGRKDRRLSGLAGQAGLAKSQSTSSSVRGCLIKQDEEQLQKTLDSDLLPTHVHSHIYVYMHIAHERRRKKKGEKERA